MRRSVITGARLLTEDMQKGGFRYRAVLITTTYRPDADYEALDMTHLVKSYRDWCCRRGIVARYQWVLELTKAERPHYHLLCFIPMNLTLPKPDKRGWWTKGATRIELARNAVGYLAKYASKGVHGRLPRGARIQGVGGLSCSSRIERRYWLLPKYVRDAFKLADAELIFKANGGGYINVSTGEVVQSEWIFAAFGLGGCVLLQRRDVGGVVHHFPPGRLPAIVTQ